MLKWFKRKQKQEVFDRVKHCPLCFLLNGDLVEAEKWVEERVFTVFDEELNPVPTNIDANKEYFACPIHFAYAQDENLKHQKFLQEQIYKKMTDQLKNKGEK